MCVHMSENSIAVSNNNNIIYAYMYVLCTCIHNSNTPTDADSSLASLNLTSCLESRIISNILQFITCTQSFCVIHTGQSVQFRYRPGVAQRVPGS